MRIILEELFIKILSMSITASYVILAILLVRIMLHRVPKIFSYMLWSVAGFRLLSSFSFSSVLSVFNAGWIRSEKVTSVAGSMDYIPLGISVMKNPVVANGTSKVSEVINNYIPATIPSKSVSPLQIITITVTCIWMVGIITLLLYGLVTYLKLRNKLQKAVLLKDNIYECDRIPSPFVLGIIKPRIYIPFRLKQEEFDYIIRHEKHHIHRLDHIIKPLAFGILILHWFNPLVWIAFYCMNKDMEMSCDEKIISDMGGKMKGIYSESLLAFAGARQTLLYGPLAFGESSAKARIKNVLRFQKPKKWILIIVFGICIITGIACAANPPANDNGGIISPQTEQKPKDDKDFAKILFDNKNKYIGDAPHDGRLLGLLEVQKEFGDYTIALETKARPYVLRVNLKNKPEMEDEAIQRMGKDSALLLALIDNADQIQWNYLINQMGEEYSKTVSYNEAMMQVSGIKDIKSYGSSEEKVYELISLSQKIKESSGFECQINAESTRKLSENFNKMVSYELPKGFTQSEFEKGIGYVGGVLFLKDKKLPQSPKDSFAPMDWYAPGAVLYLPKDVTSLEAGGAVRFKNGRLIGGTLQENHVAEIGEPMQLNGLTEQAVLTEWSLDLYTAAEAEKAKESGHEIPEDQLTSKVWRIFFAKDNFHSAYCFTLNEKYFSKEDAIEFAQTVKFSENAFD